MTPIPHFEDQDEDIQPAAELAEAHTNLKVMKDVVRAREAEAQITLKSLRAFTEAVERWTGSVGPLEEWPRLFQLGFDKACTEVSTTRSTQDAVDAYLMSVHAHSLRGKAIMAQYRATPILQPPSDYNTWGDFLTAGNNVKRLYKGIATLDVRLDILAPAGAVPSATDSHIRQWRAYTDFM